jgi:hypothetical protein
MTHIPSLAGPGRARSVSKQQFWRQVLRQFDAAGQGIRQFCRARRLSEPSFYSWRRRLAQRDAASVAPSEPVFLPVQVTGQRAGCIEIVLGGGRRIRLHGPVDPVALEQVLAVLSALSLPALSLSKESKESEPKEGRSC